MSRDSIRGYFIRCHPYSRAPCARCWGYAYARLGRAWIFQRKSWFFASAKILWGGEWWDRKSLARSIFKSFKKKYSTLEDFNVILSAALKFGNGEWIADSGGPGQVADSCHEICWEERNQSFSTPRLFHVSLPSAAQSVIASGTCSRHSLKWTDHVKSVCRWHSMWNLWHNIQLSVDLETWMERKSRKGVVPTYYT